MTGVGGNKKLSAFVVLSLLIASIIYGCIGTGLCGDGDFQAQWAITTVPLVHPLYYNPDNGMLLFESGILVRHPFNSYIKSQIDLGNLYGATAIRDIDCYNRNLVFDDFFNGSLDSLEYGEEDYFIIILARDRCCKLDIDYNFLFNFGNDGPESETIIDGIAAEINNHAQIFIVDRGDNSVKKYDIDGQFLERWGNVGEPLHIKIYDGFVYILDHLSNSIKKYDYNGNYITTALDSSFYNNISSFDITDMGVFRVIDNDGKRISELHSTGYIAEIKTEYCLDDNYFSFGRLISTDDGFYSYYLVDYENNNVIKFMFTKYTW